MISSTTYISRIGITGQMLQIFVHRSWTLFLSSHLDCLTQFQPHALRSCYIGHRSFLSQRPQQHCWFPLPSGHHCLQFSKLTLFLHLCGSSVTFSELSVCLWSQIVSPHCHSLPAPLLLSTILLPPKIMLFICVTASCVLFYCPSSP